ncbi:ATPase family AAA domain-containing protein 2B-like isoform X2 [Lycorma delicatula]|uniref:ATPase family AAA domain-containing protein 2B-like isoform X2 n=1 Tax=Lycorma delicatula TaxID=130591 RepID=UPI003F51946E
MVKTRFTADSESKMPVKDTLKEESREELDSACMSEKDNSDFSSKAPKVWSRELRNRFVISSEKRSIRFTNDVRSGRGLRSCRMALTSRQHFSLSQSDDDDDDDDRIFSPRSSSKRLKHRMGKRRIHPNPMSVVNQSVKEDNTPRRHHYLRRRQMNGIIDKAEEEQRDHELAVDGIRRSTRQRKLRYENYSDSWIVGAQTLVGYPMYGNSYSSKGAREGALKEEEDEDDDEKGGDETEEGETEGDGEEESKPVQARSHGVTVENSAQDSMADGAFQDMYSRVKRPRPTRRDMYQIKTRNAREAKSVHSSSSDESSSEDRGVSRGRERNLRVEARKYHLRKTKPTVDRFVPEVAVSRSRALREALCGSVRRRTLRHRASSSSSSSDNSDRHFDRKKPKTRSRCLSSVGQEAVTDRGSKSARTDGVGGVNVGRLADVDPISLDTSIRFSHVGGLEEHVRCLQEMVVFPMLYSEVFSKFHIAPPKGVLFHGPPGTGKTLIARALANECSQGDRKVSFFMRKGADCLSKWVGESERQLRLLFEQAHQSRPSIIFFDEIDGLAPVRSAKQDQIHASIVSTMLALMDGLDDRGDIVVIGATNRIDAIDPALRRPGRFDRELLFPLPGHKERKEILRIHVSKWEKPPPSLLLNHFAEMTVGFCGSDLRALCSEAVIHALRRKYPQIYKSSQKLLLDPDCVQVEKVDFEVARKSIVPSSYRAVPAVARKLPAFVQPLLTRPLSDLTSHLQFRFPSGFQKSSKNVQIVKSPRLLIVGQQKQTTLLSAALLYVMEQCPVHTLDLATLFCQSSRSPEEACIQIFNEVCRNVPSILYLPGLGEWWDTVGSTVQAVFKSLLCQMDPCLPVLLLATAHNALPAQLQNVFSLYCNEIYKVEPANEKEREAFFRPLILERAVQPPRPPKKKVPLPALPLAPPPAPPKLTETQLQLIYNKEENTLRELRIFLRQICAKLARNRQFFMFSKPVDVKEVPDYLSIIKEPMDLETMMTKIDLHKYTCAQDFLDDIDLLCRNALEYNPDRDPADKLIRHRACFLRDTAYALIKAEMDSDFEEQCRGIREARAGRAASPDRFVPDFVWTATNLPPNTSSIPTELNWSVQSQDNTASNHISNIDSSTNTKQNPFSSNSMPSSSHAVNTSYGILDQSANLSSNMSHSRLMRKRRHRNLWSKGFIRKSTNRLNSSHSETPLSQLRERNKTESTIIVNTKKPLHNTRSNSGSCDKQLPVINSSNNESTHTDGLPQKRKRLDDSTSLTATSFSSQGDNDQISPIIGNAEEVKEEKINDMDLDADAVFTSEEEEEMTSESCRDEIECDPSKTSSTEGTTSPKISRNKKNEDNISQATAVDATYIPPKVDELTDEEDIDENLLTETSSTGTTDIAGCMSNTNSVKKQVVVNRNTLQKVLQEVISATDGITSLELLLDLYAQLRGVINKHLKIHIRTTLPAELEAEIKRFITLQQSIEAHHLSSPGSYVQS